MSGDVETDPTYELSQAFANFVDTDTIRDVESAHEDVLAQHFGFLMMQTLTDLVRSAAAEAVAAHNRYDEHDEREQAILVGVRRAVVRAAADFVEIRP